MRINKDFVLREVAGQAFVIATGKSSKKFNGMVKLNDTGRIIWEGLAAGLSEEDIAGKLTAEYDVSGEKAMSDVEKFIADARENGFLED